MYIIGVVFKLRGDRHDKKYFPVSGHGSSKWIIGIIPRWPFWMSSYPFCASISKRLSLVMVISSFIDLISFGFLK